MVWQRFAKSPRIACAGSTPVASAKVRTVCGSGWLIADECRSDSDLQPPATAGGSDTDL